MCRIGVQWTLNISMLQLKFHHWTYVFDSISSSALWDTSTTWRTWKIKETARHQSTRLLLFYNYCATKFSFLVNLKFIVIFKCCTEVWLGSLEPDKVPLTDGLVLLHDRRLPCEAHRTNHVSHVSQDGLTLGDPQALPLMFPQVHLVWQHISPWLHLEGVITGDQVVHSNWVITLTNKRPVLDHIDQ